MRSLQELYLDENSLESLPEGILRCSALEQVDASSNRLLSLPEEMGELTNLTDLTLSHNCLTALPSSMGKRCVFLTSSIMSYALGRLKRLTIMKVDDNNITSLTPAIGSCTVLTELYMMQNLISVRSLAVNLSFTVTNNRISMLCCRSCPVRWGICRGWRTSISIRTS